MIAAEQRLLLLEPERQMVRGVPRREDGGQGEARRGHGGAVGKDDVGSEVEVARGIEQRAAGAAGPGRPAAAMGPVSGGRGAGQRLQAGGQGRMVAMGVGDQDARHGLAGEGVNQCCPMRGVVGAGIDDGDLAGADDIGVGAGEGERSRIAADQAADQRRQPVDPAGDRGEGGIELDRVHGAAACLVALMPV
jgi:hypothetical protein